MKTITYYEYYPHYMGTMDAIVEMTESEFDNLIALAENVDATDHNDDDALEALEEACETAADKADVKCYAFIDAFTGYWNDERGVPAAIVKKLAKKKGTWSGEWEEGSFAFSVKGAEAARKAVAKIEAGHLEDEICY